MKGIYVFTSLPICHTVDVDLKVHGSTNTEQEASVTTRIHSRLIFANVIL